MRKRRSSGKHRQVTAELENLFSFLRFPSISTDSRHAGDVRACAEWLLEKLTAMGLDAQVHETPKHPVVTARNAHLEGRRTVLITVTMMCSRWIHSISGPPTRSSP